MTIALNLGPNNRFILRSATRMFSHYDEHEKALYYLRKSGTSKVDPWIVSAHIAASSAISKYSPLLKNGQSLIQSKNYSFYDVTELASSIGSFEYTEGSIKKAIPFLDLSLKQPNDNSLAQYEWISSSDKNLSFNPSTFNNIKNPFEAIARDHYEKGNWVEAQKNVLMWFLDMPFESSPVILGSYIASSFTKDYDIAIMLCEVGLRANPNDPLILNNMIFSLVEANKLEIIPKYLPNLNRAFTQTTEENKIIIQATLGLVNFRMGNLQVGKKLYEIAIRNAENIKDKILSDTAII